MAKLTGAPPSPVPNLSIIVADDAPPILDGIATVLEQAGHRVRRAQTGAEAVRLWNETPCDLVVTDILMPDGDGLELIRRLRSHDAPPKIVAMSGGARAITSSHCTKMAQLLGADGVIEKPFGSRELLAVVANACGILPAAAAS
jgi:CheY-like chemotaxis protein